VVIMVSNNRKIEILKELIDNVDERAKILNEKIDAVNRRVDSLIKIFRRL